MLPKTAPVEIILSTREVNSSAETRLLFKGGSYQKIPRCLIPVCSKYERVSILSINFTSSIHTILHILSNIGPINSPVFLQCFETFSENIGGRG